MDKQKTTEEKLKRIEQIIKQLPAEKRMRLASTIKICRDAQGERLVNVRE